MKIDIVIPTRKRPKKLKLLLETIKEAIIPDVTVWVFFDSYDELNEFEAKHDKFGNWLNLRILQREFTPPNFLNDFLFLSTADVVLNLSDHCTVSRGCLREVRRVFEERFPDYDGVVGLNITDIRNQLDSAFCAFGTKFVGRFPNRAVWCPDYKVFHCDNELGQFAKSVDKFYFCETAHITYHFPNIRVDMDDTWKWSRRNKSHDSNIATQRNNANLLWGRTYDLLT